MPNIIHINDEYFRKAIHVLFTSSIVTICYLPRHTAYLLLSITTVIVFIYEKLRHDHTPSKNFIRYIRLHKILRAHEKTQWTGASYVVLATLACYCFFQTTTFALSLLVLGWGDSTAAIIGRHWGHPNANGKSIAGSASFFFISCVIIYCCTMFWHTPKLLQAGIIASGAATLAERHSARFGIDDNLSIPIVFACTMEISQLILSVVLL